MRRALSIACAVLLLGASAVSADPRATLASAAFTARSKASALQQVNEAIGESNAILAKQPNDREARLQHAIATGYHAQLTRSLSEAKETRRLMQGLVTDYPNDPEPLLALGSWHLTAVTQLGSFVAGTMLGASRTEGLRDIQRAVALGGRTHAMFPAYAAMLRIQLDPSQVAVARGLAQAAVSAPAPTPIDRALQERAVRLLVPLAAGHGDDAAALAKQMMPLAQAG